MQAGKRFALLFCLTLERPGNAGIAGQQLPQVLIQVRLQDRHVGPVLVDVGGDVHGAFAINAQNRRWALAGRQGRNVREGHPAALRRHDQVFVQRCRGAPFIPRQAHNHAYVVAPALDALGFKAAEGLADLARHRGAGKAQHVALPGQFNPQFFLAVGQAVRDVEHRGVGGQALFNLLAHRLQCLQ